MTGDPDRSSPLLNEARQRSAGPLAGSLSVVGVGRFGLPASCSQSGNAAISGCTGLYRNLPKRSDLAGVMSVRTDISRTGQYSPVLPELIHR